MSTSMIELTREAVTQTNRLLEPYIRRTPVVTTDAVDFGLAAGSLTFKLESLQHAGSFKARGAFAHMLTRDIPPAGVVAASGGNHGTAVAFAAMKLKVKATIFVPRISSPLKIDRIRRYGAHLRVEGEDYADALAASEHWRAESGAMSIHAFDAPETLTATATIGLELEDQVDAFDTLLVPVGGGGLIAGIASWFAGRVKIIAVEPEKAPKLTRALAAGYPVDAPVGGIAADSLGPRRIGTLTLPIIKRYVERVVTVSEEDMHDAQRLLWDRLSVVVEPGGAAASAALFSHKYTAAPGERVCVMVSGANTAAVDFSRAQSAPKQG
ncbi:MAG: threonine/serine dehydratase [Candidatus Eremiobacteraeota bacterium]|nr:threonine/serine dehydratase [Candidatus Eremiobacteraeota bacterium]